MREQSSEIRDQIRCSVPERRRNGEKTIKCCGNYHGAGFGKIEIDRILFSYYIPGNKIFSGNKYVTYLWQNEVGEQYGP